MRHVRFERVGLLMSERLKIFLLLLPALLVLGGLFGGGLLVAVLRSINYLPAFGLTQPTLSAYISLLSDGDFYRSLLLSFHIAFTSTLISAVLAVAAALLLRRQVFGRALANFLFQLNLTVPHLVGAIGILYLFSQSGSFARLAAAGGMIERPADFPAMVFDPYAIGIILQYVWKEVPFIGVIVLASLQALGNDYEAAARSLGASRWQTFRHVLLPMLLPSLSGASAIVFAFTFGAFEIPALLGANYPAALPVLAYRNFTNVDLAARLEAMAMSVVIALLGGIMIALYLRFSQRRARQH